MDAANSIQAMREEVSLVGRVRERSHGKSFCLSDWPATGKHSNLTAVGSHLMNKRGKKHPRTYWALVRRADNAKEPASLCHH